MFVLDLSLYCKRICAVVVIMCFHIALLAYGGFDLRFGKLLWEDIFLGVMCMLFFLFCSTLFL